MSFTFKQAGGGVGSGTVVDGVAQIEVDPTAGLVTVEAVVNESDIAEKMKLNCPAVVIDFYPACSECTVLS